MLCHVHAYNCFGGVTRLLIPDNLKTGVKSNTRYETVLNRIYQEMTWRYDTAIVMGRAEHPKRQGLGGKDGKIRVRMDSGRFTGAQALLCSGGAGSGGGETGRIGVKSAVRLFAVAFRGIGGSPLTDRQSRRRFDACRQVSRFCNALRIFLPPTPKNAP